jgi:hypothetical protein
MDAHELITRYEAGERDFGWANLYKADLNGAVLRGAVLYHVNLSEANLKGADLDRADLIAANLRAANLREAILTGANLRGANLVKADLAGADLSGAYVSGEQRLWKVRPGPTARCTSKRGGRLVGAPVAPTIDLPVQKQVILFDTGSNKNPGAYPDDRLDATCCCNPGLLARIMIERSETVLSLRPRSSRRQQRLPHSSGRS